MTNFENAVTTSNGLALLAKEGIDLTFTRIEIGSGEYESGEDVSALTELKEKRMDISIDSIIHESDTECDIKFCVTNKEATEDFLLTEIGVYASDPDKGEILYAVCFGKKEDASIIRKYTGRFIENIMISLAIQIASGMSVAVVNNGAYVDREAFDKHTHDTRYYTKEEVDAKKEEIDTKVDELTRNMGGLKFGVTEDGILTVTYDDGL